MGAFIGYSLVVLPFAVPMPAKWIIDSSEITVFKTSEKHFRSIEYFEFMDEFISVGCMIALALTIAQLVRAEGNPFDAVAIPLLMIILVVVPSLLSTALFFKFSFVKRVYRFRKSLKPVEANIHIEFKCPKCSSPLRPDEEYCTACGKKTVAA